MFLEIAFSHPVVWAIVVFVVILSVVLHELGHALVATWEGDPTPRIRGHVTWNPVVHMGWMSIAAAAVLGIAWGATPVTPRFFRHRRWGETIVSLAGPVTNLGLAVIAALIVRGMVHVPMDGEIAKLVQAFWTIVVEMNTLLFLFNMIPVPPLDGFGVLEGAVDLGELGARFRSLSPLPLLAAWFIVDSNAFHRVHQAFNVLLLGDGMGF